MDKIFLNGIMGFVVGDALGAPAEFGERWMRDLDPVKEMRSGGVFDVPPGGWTDDTSMTVATMESLKMGFSPVDMMNRFLSWYRTGEYSWCKKPIGVGKQILKALEHYEQNLDIHICGGADEIDNGNGSLMRILPVCLQVKQGNYHIEDAIQRIHETSVLTHAHKRSLIACGMYYFIVSAILDGKEMFIERIQKGIDEAFRFYAQEPELEYYTRVRNLQEFRHVEREQISSSGYVIDTFEAVIWCLITTETFKECLLKAVNLGLDTDTIAAIAGGLAGLYYGYKEIPQEWLEVIKERERLEELCRVFDRI